ncbi:hypothetical protein MMC11_001920 [Xylographa trunciseda]|nr:hypothetical protein [Xylographa trunciseda]
MDLFDWERAGAPDHTDPGDLSELLASTQPLDVPLSPPHQFHASLSDADLLALTTPEHGQYQNNIEQGDNGFDDNILEWRGLELGGAAQTSEHDIPQAIKDVVGSDPDGFVEQEVLRTLQPGNPLNQSPNAVQGLRRKISGNGTRLSPTAIKILKEWLHENAQHPYLTEKDRILLKAKTGLRNEQINNWLANARRRGKVPIFLPSSSKASPDKNDAKSHALSKPLAIPTTGQGHSYGDLNPLDRWRNSPPQDEPASASAISNAVAATYSIDDINLMNPNGFDKPLDSGDSFAYEGYRARSESSWDTAGSSGSDWSNTSLNSVHSRMSQRRGSRRRRRNAGLKQGKTQTPDDQRPYECTFCTDSFKTKYDWQRHEKTYHLSLERWQCAPQGPTQDGGISCAFCGQLSPTPAHLSTHNYAACAEQPVDARTFFRKDHLRQHLRLFHAGCAYHAPSMDAWVRYDYDVASRCGFCGAALASWPARVEHLGAHFQAGARMRDWTGEHGFAAHVEDRLESDIPPYLIQHEKKTPDPFSASNAAHRRTATLSAGAELHWSSAQTPWLDLAKQLYAFVKRQIAADSVPGDEEIRRQARVLVYGDADDWNQTRADIPEWFEEFKMRAGLVGVGGEGGRNVYVGRGKATEEVMRMYN